MNSIAVSCHIKAFAIMVEVEGMKAFNRHREMQGLTQAYGEDSFLALSNSLYALATEALEHSNE